MDVMRVRPVHLMNVEQHQAVQPSCGDVDCLTSLQCVRRKRDQNVLIISRTKLAILMKFGT